MGLLLPHYIEQPTNINFKDIDITTFQEFGVARPTWINTSRFATQLPKNKNFKTYGCRYCRTHLSSTQAILSKDYRGKTGDAYLMSNVVNILEGEEETRSMMTGDYVVCDIICQWCNNVIGWKYLKSDSSAQRYKEGKFIMELKTVCICD